MLFDQSKINRARIKNHLYGFFVVSILFVLLEIRVPYFFLQDDNYSQFFPILKSALDFIYKTGSLPLYDFKHMNGVEVLGLTQYGILDPILNSSYLLTMAFNCPYALLDIYVFIYYQIGTYLIIKLFPQYKLSNILLAACLFSGHLLITIRSWYYLAPYVLMLIIIIYRVLQTFYYEKKYTTLYIDTLVLSFFIYFGNPQFFIYNFIIFFLFISFTLIKNYTNLLLLLKKISLTGSIFLMVSLPILYLYHKVDNQAPRFFNVEGLHIRGIINMVIPFVKNNVMWTYSSEIYYNWLYFYLNIFSVIGLLASFKWLFNTVKSRKLSINNSSFFSVLILVVLLLTTNFYYIFKYIPIFNKFKIALKFYYIFIIASQIYGFIYVNYHLKKKLKVIVYILSSVQILMMVFLTDISFFHFSYNYKDPYNKHLVDSIHSQLTANAKIASFAPERSSGIDYSSSLTHNFARIFNINSYDGYEPMVNNHLINYDFTSYGITHFIFYNDTTKDKWRYLNDYDFVKRKIQAEGTLIKQIGNVDLYALNDKSYSEKFSKIDLAYNSAKFVLAKKTSLYDFELKTNYNKNIQCYVDGKSVHIEKYQSNIIIKEAVEGTDIELKYSLF